MWYGNANAAFAGICKLKKKDKHLKELFDKARSTVIEIMFLIKSTA